jgi:hypothetical protein
MLLFALIGASQAVEARYTATPPRIDGIIEPLWQKADSAYDFIQYQPKDGEPAAEPTVVYVLADENNLYFAYRCYTVGRKPYRSYKGYEDHLYLYLDTFDGKTTAYFFSACLSGYYEDGLILEDGKIWDRSWDGVWFFKSKMYDDRFEMEFQIPFKTIRYKKGITEWGVNFQRNSVKNFEISYWAPVTQKEELQISKFARLTGLKPEAKGYYVELYPEALLRYDRIGDSTHIQPRGSFNFKWDLTSQSTLNGTIYPDFAQIESDPYSVNLSRYPLRFSERRPFFVEGSDVFRMTSSGDKYFTPLEIFYSRRIGKALAPGHLVPIIGGLKYFTKEKRWKIGVLGAMTDTFDVESRRGFGAMRLRHSLLDNSEIGMLVSSSTTGKDDYNYAVGIDGAYRRGPSQFILQTALSDRNAKRGWAVASSGVLNKKRWKAAADIIAVADSFDVGDIGYVPWNGLRQAFLGLGPRWFYNRGMINRLYIGPGLTMMKDPGSNEWSKIARLETEARFLQQWGSVFMVEAGSRYEADTNYLYRNAYGSIWSGYHKLFNVDFEANYTYCYNYREYFLGNQMSVYAWGAYFPVSPLSLSSSIAIVAEWDTVNCLSAVTPYITPRVEYRINNSMEIDLYTELVFQTAPGNYEDAKIYSNRIGCLFSWNFRPKSWVYLAFNNYQERDTLDRLSLINRIGAIKVKYLLYF